MIRDARPDDIASLIGQGRTFHARSDWRDRVPFVAEDFEDSLNRALRQSNGILVVSEHGFAMAVMAPSLWNRTVHVAQDLVVWGDGRLLGALEDRARQKGAGWFLMARQAAAGLRPEVMARWLRRRGYVEQETVFLKDIRHADH